MAAGNLRRFARRNFGAIRSSLTTIACAIQPTETQPDYHGRLWYVRLHRSIVHFVLCAPLLSSFLQRFPIHNCSREFV